jgi:hypothetical protein
MKEKFKVFFKEVYRASQWDAQGDADHACEHYSPSNVLDYLTEIGETELVQSIKDECGEPEF